MAEPSNITPTSPPVALHCLRGGAAPPGIAADLLCLLALPEGAQQHLWEALGPSLPEPIPASIETLLTRFAERHAVADDQLARAIRACRFVLRAAARIDLDRARFAEDLRRLAGDDAADRMGTLLLPGFERAKAHVRAELLERTVVAQGRFVEAIDWRVEEITSSNRGEGFRHRVALVTLHCREGEQKEQITLHMGAEVLEELAQVYARLRPGQAPG
ncbi:Hypothetical protein A7982_01324 [Minicystis rosea]|nr:Hypothetical protein A7982_01324 [Minicystis rosea]